MRWSCVFLLSPCSARGRRLLSLLLGFASVPLPAAPAVFRGVSCRRFTLRRLRNLSGSICLSCSCGGAMSGVCGGFSAALVFSLLPCSSYGACSFAQLPLPPVTLRGSCVFSAYVCLPNCCAGGVGWAATLPLRSQCFSCAGWLADGRWVLHPVTGFSH